MSVNGRKWSSLSEKQMDFTRCQGLLIGYAYSKGYALTDAGGEDTNKNDGHMKDSCHHYRLAQDWNLFLLVDGKRIFIKNSTDPVWEDLHSYWEALGGAPMVPGDANHFSFKHNGKI